MPWIESYRISRMRENRTSGLRRGEAAATLPLSYSTFLLFQESASGRPESDASASRRSRKIFPAWHNSALDKRINIVYICQYVRQTPSASPVFGN